MKHVVVCLSFITLCLFSNSADVLAAGGGKKKSVKELEAIIKQSDEKNSDLEKKLLELDQKYKDLQRFVNSSSCSTRKEKTLPECEPKENLSSCNCSTKTENECSGLEEQNESLRETIRAQNEYLLQIDNSGQISQKLIDENNESKSKAHYLEQASKSSAEEIKNLMILNESLQKELSQCQGGQSLQ